MVLEFINQGGQTMAEFEATSDFNLHIEGVYEGDVRVYQSTVQGGKYAFVKGSRPNPAAGNVYDYDFTALVFPKFIKVVCANQPTYAEVVSASASSGGSEDGGNTSVKADDVRFFDYDGTLLYAYSWEEAKNLIELPALPVHEGLEVREWNYTLEDIHAQGEKYVGGVWGKFKYVGNLTIDGVTYQAWNPNGDYSEGYWAILVTGEPKEGGIGYYAECHNGDGTAWFIEPEEYEIIEVGETIGKVDVGACAYDGDGEQVFVNGVYIIPRGDTSVPSAYNTVVGLYSVPVTVEGIWRDTVYNCIFLREIRIPKDTDVANGGYDAFLSVIAPNCYWNGMRGESIRGIEPLAKLNVADNVVVLSEIPNNCHVVASSIILINNAYFNYYSRTILDFSEASLVPPLADVNYESPFCLMIVVPDELYDEWVNATNWSDISRFIYRVSEVPWIKE